MNAISNRVVVKMSWFVVAVIVTCPVRAEAPTVQPVPDGYVGGPYKVIAAEFTGDAHIAELIGLAAAGGVISGSGGGNVTGAGVMSGDVAAAEPNGGAATLAPESVLTPSRMWSVPQPISWSTSAASSV